MKKLSLIIALVLIAAGVAPVQSFAKWSGYRIMLDPGHGGSDPGASGPSAPHEGELALRAVKAMDTWLTARSNPHKLTRSSNTTVSLSARRSASISYDPYIFCSVHLNAFNGSAHGTETWYYWSAGNSSKLAQKVQAQLVAKLGRTNRGVKQNGWTVITGSSSIPAILTEALFVDNKTEWSMINTTDKAGFKNWVNAHLKGFYDYLNAVQSAGCEVNPDDTPYGGGGGTVTPPVTEAGTITAPSGLHFTGYVGEEPTLTLSITGKNMKTAMTVKANYAARFVINGKTDNSVTVPAAGGSVTVKFADPYKNNVAGTYGEGGTATINGTSMNIKFTITISGTGNDGKTVTKTVALTAELKTPPLKPTEKWNFSEKKGNKTEKGYDASQIRNFCYYNGKLYCVYQHKYILVLNAQTGEKLGFLKRGDVVKGGTLELCDVKVLNGNIVACNLATEGQELHLYSWKSDNENPYLLYSTTDFQGLKRIGDCLEMTGTFDTDCWFAFAGQNSGDKTLIVEYQRKNGQFVLAKNTPVYTVSGTTASNLSTQATVRAYPKGSGWWVDGKDSYPTWATYDATYSGAVRKTYVDTGESWGSSHHEFNYGGQKYSANLVFNGKEYKAGTTTLDPDKNYKGARMRIIADLTGDFTRMQQLGDYPSAGLGDETRNTNATGDIMINTDGSKYFESWVLSTSHGMAYYAHGDVPAKSPAKLELQNPDDEQQADPDPTISADVKSIALKAIVGQSASKTVAITGKNLKGNITVSLNGGTEFTIDKTELAASGNVSVTYKPTAVGSHTATLTISTTGATNIEIPITGTGESQIVFSDEITADKVEAVWSYTSADKGDWFLPADNYTTSIAEKDGKLYVLNCKPWAAPEIVEVDAYTGKATGKKLNVTGITGGTVQVGSIFFVDGVLYGVNTATASQPIKIYRWNDIYSAPECVVTDSAHGGVIAGRKASYGGGRIYLVSDGGTTLLYYTVSGTTVSTSPTAVTLKKADGNNFFSGSTDGRGSAGVVDNGDGTIWVISKEAAPTRFKLDGSFVEQMKASAVGGNALGTDMTIMPFGTKTYVAATTYADKLTNGQFVLIDATSGMAAASEFITRLPANGLGATTNAQFTTTMLFDYRKDKHVLDMWLCVPFQGVAHYSVNGETDAVDTIIADQAEGDVEYFNLQGVKVDAKNLVPGVYVRRQGKVATKVLVK